MCYILIAGLGADARSPYYHRVAPDLPLPVPFAELEGEGASGHAYAFHLPDGLVKAYFLFFHRM